MLESARVSLDDTSRRIIEQLQQDGRRAYAAIGKAVGLSEAAVRQRVQRLVDSGVISIVAVPDPALSGRPRQALLGVQVVGNVAQVRDQVRELEPVVRTAIVAGSMDLFVELACVDDEELVEVTEQIRAFADVVRTETFVCLRPTS